MTLPLQAVEEATPDRLTALLEDAGLLAGRRVTSVDICENDAFNSTVAHLELQVENAPIRLLLKLNHEGQGREEIAFYNLIAEAKADTPMLVPCVSAAFDPESGASHLLLVDVSETHAAPVNRDELLGLNGVPPEPQIRAVTEALARLHAAFWEHPLLDKHPATRLTQRYRDRSSFKEWWTKHRQDYETFVKAHGDTVSSEVHHLLQRALENYPTLWGRFMEPRSRNLTGFTVTHNDCYLTQFLCPKLGRGATYLVDFQDACTDFAARDLVYLLATFWTREQRRTHERSVLEHYHQTLLEHGVRGYTLEQLFEDYRLMLIDMVFHPVWDTTYGADPAYWRAKLTCLTDAYSDWDCDTLLRV